MDQNESNINDSRVDIARLQEELSSVKAELTSEREKNEKDKKYTEQLVEAVKDLVETNKKLKGNNQLQSKTRSFLACEKTKHQVRRSRKPENHHDIVYHGEECWIATNRLKERIAKLGEEKRDLLLDVQKLRKENEKLCKIQKQRKDQVDEVFEYAQKLLRDNAKEKKEMQQDFKSKEKEMKDKEDHLEKMLAATNEDRKILEQKQKEMVDELERSRKEVVKETEDHSATKAELERMQRSHDDSMKTYEISLKETTAEHEKEREVLKNAIIDLEKALQGSEKELDEERREVRKANEKIAAIEEDNANLRLTLTNEKILREEETVLNRKLAEEVSEMIVTKSLVLESNRKTKEKKNRLKIAYEQMEDRIKEQERILEKAQDYARALEEDNHVKRLRKKNKKGWGRVKFWK